MPVDARSPSARPAAGPPTAVLYAAITVVLIVLMYLGPITPVHRQVLPSILIGAIEGGIVTALVWAFLRRPRWDDEGRPLG